MTKIWPPRSHGMHSYLCTCVHVHIDEKFNASRWNPLDDKLWPPRSHGMHSYLFTWVHDQTDEKSNASHVRPQQSKTTQGDQHGFLMRCMHVRTWIIRGERKSLLWHVFIRLAKTNRWQIFDPCPHGSVLAFYLVNKDQRSKLHDGSHVTHRKNTSQWTWLNFDCKHGRTMHNKNIVIKAHLH